MSDTVTAAIVGVGGAVLVAVVSVVTQLFVTRNVIRAERERLAAQLYGEEASRAREKREQRLLDAISELLAASDPQSDDGVRYGRVANLIIHVQLLLDLNVPVEKSLNGALNDLGFRLQEYHPVRQRPIDDKIIETKALLRAHDAVIERTKIVLRGISPPAT
jgi:hypothetical protein